MKSDPIKEHQKLVTFERDPLDKAKNTIFLNTFFVMVIK